MNKFTLNNETLQRIHTVTGLDARDISTSDVGKVDSFIEKRKGTVLSPAVNVGGLSPRGSVYLMFSRFLTQKEIDRRIDSIKS